MRFAGCWKWGLIVLGTVMILSGGCAKVASDPTTCPPVVQYSPEDQRRTAAELEALPQGSVIEGMLVDYHVMRRQAAACGSWTEMIRTG